MNVEFELWRKREKENGKGKEQKKEIDRSLLSLFIITIYYYN